MHAAFARFNQLAPLYLRSPLQRPGRSGELLRALPAFHAARTVVDVGCGPGGLSLDQALPTQTIIGVDPAPKMLEHFLTRAMCLGVTARGVLASAEDLPLATGLHDLVVSRLTLHLCPDPARTIQEMLRVLRPGGSLVIADVAGFDDLRLDELCHLLGTLRDPGHQRALSLPALARLCRQNGAEVRASELVERELDRGLSLEDWLAVSGTPPHKRDEIKSLLAAMPPRDRQSLGIELIGGRYLVPLRSYFLHAVKLDAV